MKGWKWILVLIISVGLLACGKDNPADGGDPPPPTPPREDPMKVGSGGGSVSNSDSTVTLSIPSGSLSSEVTFTVEETTSYPGNAVGKVYDIGPEGTQFDLPATLTIKYDDTDLPSGAQESELVLATVENNAWTELTSTIDEQNNTVSAEISHLSMYGILRIQPAVYIGSDGGTVTSADGRVTLVIPPNALEAGELYQFKIEELDPAELPTADFAGKVYKIEPQDVFFSRFTEDPLLTISYEETDVPSGYAEEDLLPAEFDQTNFRWNLLQSLNSGLKFNIDENQIEYRRHTTGIVTLVAVPQITFTTYFGGPNNGTTTPGAIRSTAASSSNATGQAAEDENWSVAVFDPEGLPTSFNIETCRGEAGYVLNNNSYSFQTSAGGPFMETGANVTLEATESRRLNIDFSAGSNADVRGSVNGSYVVNTGKSDFYASTARNMVLEIDNPSGRRLYLEISWDFSGSVTGEYEAMWASSLSIEKIVKDNGSCKYTTLDGIDNRQAVYRAAHKLGENPFESPVKKGSAIGEFSHLDPIATGSIPLGLAFSSFAESASRWSEDGQNNGKGSAAVSASVQIRVLTPLELQTIKENNK